MAKNKVKKVLIFAGFFNNFGGCEYYNFWLAKLLCESGIEVRIYIGERPRKDFWLTKLQNLNIKIVVPNEFHKNLNDIEIEKKLIFENVKDINLWKPDIIHTHPLGKLGGAWLNNTESDKSIPIVLTEYTTPSEYTKHWFVSNYPDYLNQVSGIIATCNEVKKGVINYFRYKGIVKVIPHLIPKPQLPSFKIETKKIGFIGRLAPEKGLTSLVLSWYHLIKKNSQYKLYIYGEGDDKEGLENLVESLNLKDNIFFMGTFNSFDDIDSIADQYSIFIQPSYFESIPTTIIELMSRGKIIISSNVGGIREIIKNKKTGFLYPVATVETLVKTIYKVTNYDLDALKQISNSAFKLTSKKYEPNQNFNEILKFYNKVIDNNNKA